MNYLARKIIIWYAQKSWAEEVFDDICSHLPPDSNYKISKKYLFLHDDNGLILEMVHADDCGRRYRAHENYIQSGIDRTIYRDIIAPHLMQPSSEAWVISEARQIYQGATRASDYYDL